MSMLITCASSHKDKYNKAKISFQYQGGYNNIFSSFFNSHGC